MAYRGKKIENPAAKMSIHFLQTKNDTAGSLHYHPHQEEDFTVLEGELTVRMPEQTLVLKQGDSLHIGRGIKHSMWNNTHEKTIVHWQVRPAMNSEHLFETAAGLAKDGKVNKNGMPGILQVALMANKCSRVFRLSKPAFVVQKILFTVLSPFAFLVGLQADYEEYLD